MPEYAKTQKELVDLAMVACGVPSPYALAKFLSAPTSVMQKARRGETFLSKYYIGLLCEFAGLDEWKTLACISLEEAKTKGKEKEIEFWEKRAA